MTCTETNDGFTFNCSRSELEVLNDLIQYSNSKLSDNIHQSRAVILEASRKYDNELDDFVQLVNHEKELYKAGFELSSTIETILHHQKVYAR